MKARERLRCDFDGARSAARAVRRLPRARSVEHPRRVGRGEELDRERGVAVGGGVKQHRRSARDGLERRVAALAAKDERDAAQHGRQRRAGARSEDVDRADRAVAHVVEQHEELLEELRALARLLLRAILARRQRRHGALERRGERRHRTLLLHRVLARLGAADGVEVDERTNGVQLHRERRALVYALQQPPRDPRRVGPGQAAAVHAELRLAAARLCKEL